MAPQQVLLSTEEAHIVQTFKKILHKNILGVDYCVSSLPWTVCAGWPSHIAAAPPGLSSCTTSSIPHLSLPLSVEIKDEKIVAVLNMFILNSHCHIMFPLLTSTQALKVLSKVKGSPWLLCRGWRAVAQSGLCCELRRKGDWTLRAAATVNTGSTRLNKEPSTSIFPEWTKQPHLTKSNCWLTLLLYV